MSLLAKNTFWKLLEYILLEYVINGYTYWELSQEAGTVTFLNLFHHQSNPSALFCADT